MKRRAEKEITSTKETKKRKGEEPLQKEENEEYDMYVVKKILDKNVDKRGNVKYRFLCVGYP